MIRRVVIVCALLLAAAGAAHAQDPVVRPDTIEAAADTIPSGLPVPRGAFIRAMLVPGWGHLYIHAPRRGAVYVALQGASWFMLVKTIRKLNDVKDVVASIEKLGHDSIDVLLAQDTMMARLFSERPELYEQKLAEIHPELSGKRDLVGARKRHRQDWIVYTVFFTFAAAADAYVTAHLADFPGEITTSRSADGRFAIGLQFNVGGRRP
jgi:hypothetical protein